MVRFVWSDYSAEQDFAATAVNQFCIRAQNGIVVEAFGNVAFYTGVGTTDPGRYVQLLNSPRAPPPRGSRLAECWWPTRSGTQTPVKTTSW